MTEAQLGKKELTVFHLEASLLLANKCKYPNFLHFTTIPPIL